MVRERDLQGKGPSSILGGEFLFFLVVVVETLPIIVRYFNINTFKNGSDRLRKGNLPRRQSTITWKDLDKCREITSRYRWCLIDYENYPRIRVTDGLRNLSEGYGRTFLHAAWHCWLRVFEAGSHKINSCTQCMPMFKWCIILGVIKLVTSTVTLHLEKKASLFWTNGDRSKTSQQAPAAVHRNGKFWVELNSSAPCGLDKKQSTENPSSAI